MKHVRIYTVHIPSCTLLTMLTRKIFWTKSKRQKTPKTNLDIYQIRILSAMATSLSHNLQDFNGSI